MSAVWEAKAMPALERRRGGPLRGTNGASALRRHSQRLLVWDWVVASLSSCRSSSTSQSLRSLVAREPSTATAAMEPWMRVSVTGKGEPTGPARRLVPLATSASVE